MEATKILGAQLKTVNYLLHTIADDIDVTTSRQRAYPGTNLIGFTLWHVARTADWAVNAMIRGEPEVAFDAGFTGAADPRTNQFGVRISLEQADEIAHATTPAEVAAYHDRVVENVVEWLKTGPDLTAVPDLTDRQPDHPGYAAAGYIEEIKTFPARPTTVGMYLSGPAIGHARGHFGEIDVLRQIIALS